MRLFEFVNMLEEGALAFSRTPEAQGANSLEGDEALSYIEWDEMFSDFMFDWLEQHGVEAGDPP